MRSDRLIKNRCAGASDEINEGGVGGADGCEND